MSATPRVRSGAFPVTPRTVRRPAASFPTPQSNMSSVRSTPESAGPAPKKQPLPEAPESKPTASSGPQPRIPTSILEAPTQRLYVAGIYVGLLGWRLWDWIQVVENDADSNWLLFKWAVLDAVFFFGLPELRIPWLELSSPFASAAWLFHVFVTLAMMYNIGFPFQAWLLAFVKAVYDRELAVSEHSIRVSDLIHNSSLIMGKQIINILPEGSAVLNPEGVPFCLGGDVSTVSLPIFFNATIPDEVELVRADFDGERQETLRLNRNQLKDIAKRAKRNTEEATEELVRFDYPVKKVGVYRLSKVLDEYKLEVQRPSPDTLVVQCPRARIVPPASSSRCFGDLSDLSLEVEGSPPLKIVYSRTINGKDHSFHFQSLQPDGFTSPLLGSPPSMSLVRPGEDDMSWARPRKVPVGLNESMNIAGAWQYSVDEVHDAFGNVARYSHPADDPELKPKPKHLVQNFVVKERPRLGFKGCDSRNPLKAQRGKAVNLPVELRFSGRMPDDTSYRVAWQFSPIDTLTQSGEPGDVVIEESYSASNAHDRPVVYKPGLYTLKSVSSGSCEGEIQEPSACLLMNPLEPSISLSAQDIADKCAGNSIGLRVAMDLIGTPPFVVRYDVYDKDNRHLATHREKIPGLRHQMDLTPREAGHYKYKFTEIDDSIYKHQPLRGPDMVLEQTVKPAASAKIVGSSRTDACLEDVAEVRVALLGDGPFNLAWEMVHDGKRTQHSATAIDASEYTIKTPPLSKAGSYTLTLTSVEDKAGCRTFLKDEVKIEVRRRPRAGFGLMDGRRKVTVVEGSLVNIPLRLHGVPPFSLDYRNLNGSAEPVTREFGSANDALRVRSPGVYEITAVRDSQCDGTVDELASTFEVDLFPRPELAIIEADGITQRGNVYVKKDVCEGDIDGFEISLKGAPPYHVEYEVRHKSTTGSQSIANKGFDAALGTASISMDTSKPGLWTYKFSALEDNLYKSDKSFTPLIVEQRVNAKPSATFARPGHSWKYCRSESPSDDKIPINLVGVPPFYVELEIKHQSGVQPDLYRIPSINSNSYGVQIPREYLKLGVQQVRIRNVRDARGCQQRTDSGGPSVQVQLFDAPAIYPLETRSDYCVGDRISYTLSGTPPFEVWYTFQGHQKKAKAPTTSFRRVAESPGVFTITSVADRASECRASVNITKTIHPLPSVRVSKGKQSTVDIHEGGEVEILFEFSGTPPFEFTYTRSTNAKKGQRSQVLETRHDVSTEYSKIIRASQEGTYEVVAIRDAYCAFSTAQAAQGSGGGGKQKLLQ